MVTALRDAGIASIEGNAAVGILTSIAKKTTASIAIPKTAVPDKGDLAIELPAKVSPEVKPAKAGTAAITVGPLETLLLPRDAKGEPVPDTKKVTCTLVDGQTVALGAVKVTPAVPATSVTVRPPGSTPPPTSDRKQPQGKEKKPKGKTRLQDDPPLCGDPVDPFAIWTYYPLSGHVDVKKLGSGIDFGPPGYLNAQLNTWTDPNSGMLCNNLVGQLLWLPSRGKFTTFEFMPTEATVTITETAPTQGLLDNGVFIGGAKTDMRMSDVTVNGTPLPVGPKCHTVTPVEIGLHSDPEKWNPFGSPPGLIEAEFTIPKFAGCGVGQDLNPLFNGLISGPGNKIRLDFFSDIVFCEDITQPCAPPLKGKR
jgi:hypothetical protein